MEDDEERGVLSHSNTGANNRSISNRSDSNIGNASSSGNASGGGVGGGSASDSGSGDNGIDLVIVDYDITDCFSLMNQHNNNNDNDSNNVYNGTSNRTHPQPPDPHLSNPPQSNLLAATELLVRRILSHKSMPAVMFTNVAVPNTGVTFGYF